MGEGLGQPSQEQRLVEPALGHERLAARLQALGNLPFLSSLRASFNSGAIKETKYLHVGTENGSVVSSPSPST